MAEVNNYVFDYREVAEALIKKQGLRNGLWGIYMEFGIAAANIHPGPAEETIVPAAIVPVMKIGIQRFDKPGPLTVDAATVNPPPRIARKPAKPDSRAQTVTRNIESAERGRNA